MLMHTPANPPPPIHGRVLRIRHVGARIKAPFRGLLGSYLASVAEERPDGLRAAGVARVMLLFRF